MALSVTQKMAVAGLHNVSAFGPLFVESQSSGSSLWEEPQIRPSTRASSLLQMWRELEDEHVMSPSCRQRHRISNGSDSDCTSIVASVGQGIDNGDDTSESADESENHGRILTRSETNLEDSDSIISGQSSDLGDIERERVRQVFREWMNNGAKGHSPDGFPLNNNTGEQCLSENVRERVRIIKEWVQTVARHGNNNGSLGDEVAEVGSQIEQSRDGHGITRPEIGARRPVQRLCGRQTLLDLLLRAQSERNRELRDLSEQRPVSDFAHRNRIQALLRGRFLRNEILITDKRPSMAATELGLLRQRSTVSDLRDGFLSKLHNSTSIPGNSAEASSSLSDETNGEAESTRIRGVTPETHTASVSEIDADENRSQHEFVSRVTEVEDSALDHDGNAEVSLGIESSRGAEQPTFDSEASGHSSRFDQSDAVVNDEPSLEYVEINYSGPLEVLHEHYEPSDASRVHGVAGNTADMEGNTNEAFDRQDALTLEEEAQDSEIRIDNNSWHQLTGVAFTEWTDAIREDTTGNQWFRETSDDEQDQIQGSREFWPNHNFQEAVDSWLDVPTGEVSGSVGRMDTFYFPDDDNVQSMELRELFSWRRVSSLLRSGFRESLDQVLQSHVERQGHASGDWEPDTTSSPVLIEPDQEQLNGEQTLVPSDGSEINEFDHSSIHITASQPLWDEVLPGANWPHITLNQHMGTEWDVINELRIDMARLQQRMNNMQSMLEACMELQIQLQRSVHQEVSAALNQSILSRVPFDAISGADSRESNILHHESKWDFVRKGICCLCCDSNIDSLLYRCGHMCTCSKCAEGLVQGSGKCPMCEAPIVEVVRAYLIH
ncbi:uncharacterized protein [Primulina huaijiensis]|uniref:uncharacterized protein isoform X1 n=1 Tax=Primulina huaijiensis TaxID=1492673 RepID=UPI003CC6FE8B